MRIRKSFVALLAAGTMAGLPALASAQATTPQREGEARQVTLRPLSTDGKVADLQELVGKPVADFTLTDTEGKEHTLSEYLGKGKIVVLEWFNGNCPYVVPHYNGEVTMNDLAAKYKDKGVVWLGIATGGTADKDVNEKFREDWNIKHPILLDKDGVVGMTYGSKNTPTMYVIHKDGTLVYGGGIDDNPRFNKANPTNYVVAALDAILAGSNVTETYAKPYGCSVKYPRR
jgi:peroxiredoxin